MKRISLVIISTAFMLTPTQAIQWDPSYGPPSEYERPQPRGRYQYDRCMGINRDAWKCKGIRAPDRPPRYDPYGWYR